VSTTTGPDVGAAPVGGPTLRHRLRGWRGPVGVGLLVLLTALLLALLSDSGARGLLRPDATDPSGSAALAALLREQGVRVDVARTAEEAADAGPGTTLLVADPSQLDRAGRVAVAHSGADVVLVRPGPAALALVPGVGVTGAGPDSGDVPGCALPAAVAAGSVDLAADAYAYRVAPTAVPAASPPPTPAAQPGVVACYTVDGASSLLVRPFGPATITLVGDTAPFTNEALVEKGNAALALRLLGEHPRVVWYLPVPIAEPGDATLSDLVPPGWVWGAVQLAVAAVLAALWRARRLGPVVAEPLPVVVRATETTEGRARLYRRAGARDRAAAALRAETRRVLAGRLGLAPTASAAELADALAARPHTPAGRVRELLDGPAPPDDRALVALAADLDALRDAASGTVATGTGRGPADGRTAGADTRTGPGGDG